MNVIFAFLAYIVFALAVALTLGRLFHRQKSRDPFIVCRSCASRNACHAPAGLDTCSTVAVEDSVRAVLDGIPQFKDI